MVSACELKSPIAYNFAIPCVQNQLKITTTHSLQQLSDLKTFSNYGASFYVYSYARLSKLCYGSCWVCTWIWRLCVQMESISIYLSLSLYICIYILLQRIVVVSWEISEHCWCLNASMSFYHYNFIIIFCEFVFQHLLHVLIFFMVILYFFCIFLPYFQNFQMVWQYGCEISSPFQKIFLGNSQIFTRHFKFIHFLSNLTMT